jgi:hypothetical protein
VTIILSLINEDQAILISDQKLSGSAPGTEWTKSTFVTTSDGRFGLGLAGLATVGSFDISQWILETLIRCGPPDFTSLGIIERFATAATEFFAQRSAIRRVSPELRRLTLMFSGYLDGHSPPLAASAFVTNFQDWKTGTDSDTAWAKFDTRFENERRPNHGGPFSYTQRIGARPAVNDADVAQLREMLEARRPSRAIVECAVGIVRHGGPTGSAEYDWKTCDVAHYPSRTPPAPNLRVPLVGRFSLKLHASRRIRDGCWSISRLLGR